LHNHKKLYVAGFGRGNSIDVWCGKAYNIGPITCLMMFKKEKRKRCLQMLVVVLLCWSVMFLNFGQLCGFEINGGTKRAVKITAAFMTFLQKVQG